jgi:hypothetical protein
MGASDRFTFKRSGQTGLYACIFCPSLKPAAYAANFKTGKRIPLQSLALSGALNESN